MKRNPIILSVLILSGLMVWNVMEFPDFRPDEVKILSLTVPESASAPELDWKWFDRVKIDVQEIECKLVSLPDELQALDGKEVVVTGASFACGDDIREDEAGYSIQGFILVPYFGMIDCCVGNPVPYFQWTIVVEKLDVLWRINHKGIIDPTVAVQGVFRVERESSMKGIFFLEDARVIHSAEDELENRR